MPITVNSKFRFNQRYVQGNGGWCGGICHAVITHLYENLAPGQQHVDPNTACAQTQEYVSLLIGTFNKITGVEATWAAQIRQPASTLQTAFEERKKPPGKYEYKFNQPGTAMLFLLVVDNNNNYGSSFQSWWSLGEVVNHAGVAVWDTNGSIFLFDPNCGGIMVHWVPCSVVPSFPIAVDMALQNGYAIFDVEHGGRTAKTVSALKLTESALPYGSV